jgi:lipopolysaccharide/colanic/teichoic acid biosynthesis glycosyltransferase
LGANTVVEDIALRDVRLQGADRGGDPLTQRNSDGGEVTGKSDLLAKKSPSLEVMTLVVPVNPLPETFAARLIKRVADVFISLFALAVLSPIILIVAILIYLEDRGPVIYRQSRVGRFGVPFRFYKFRSMRMNADQIREQILHMSDAKGAAFKMKNDPRITKVGRLIRKLSIDELPQLGLVLSGHMSIIGPRPHLSQEVETYLPEQRVRLLVKPGLICLREIRGRSDLTFDQWLASDLEYVENRSLWLDAKIFVLAIPAVLTSKGAY